MWCTGTNTADATSRDRSPRWYDGGGRDHVDAMGGGGHKGSLPTPLSRAGASPSSNMLDGSVSDEVQWCENGNDVRSSTMTTSTSTPPPPNASRCSRPRLRCKQDRRRQRVDDRGWSLARHRQQRRRDPPPGGIVGRVGRTNDRARALRGRQRSSPRGC